MIACFGFIADRLFTIQTRSISQLLIYFASPALVFSVMLKTRLKSDELVILTLFTVLLVLGIAAISYLLTRILRLNREQASAFTLSTTMMNAGNIGLPLVAFALGDEGLSRAAVVFTVSAIMGNTLGIFLASSGNASIKQSLLNVVKVPLGYAILLGLIANQGYFGLPGPVAKGVDLLGQASIPMMLLMLGIQLSRTRFNAEFSLVTLASAIRIIGAPILGFLLAKVLLVSGLTAQVLILETSMPTAVTAIILAEEFGSDARFVSSVVLVSTVLSLITLSVLLSLLL
jgi:predicted permease